MTKFIQIFFIIAVVFSVSYSLDSATFRYKNGFWRTQKNDSLSDSIIQDLLRKEAIVVLRSGKDSSDSMITFGINNSAYKFEISGKRSVENIRHTIYLNLPKVQKLYNNCLKRDSNLAGEVLMRIDIDKNGKVISCKVDKTNMQSYFILDLIALIRNWHFGKIDGHSDTTTIKYPFKFAK